MMAGFIAEPALRLSHLLGEILPPGLKRIFYSDNGSTSVEVALKVALQYHSIRGESRNEFVALGGGYHGDTLGAMSVGGIEQFHGLFQDRFKKHLITEAPYCYRCPEGKEPKTCSADCMNSMEKIFSERHDKIAACIFEPMVQGASGMRIYPPKVLKRIFTLCKTYKILTIADEVAMGFGRTGTMFACDHVSEIPDIMCLAKGLTGGYLPMAATVVKEEIFDEFKGDYRSNRTFNHGHTFTGNALASSAACASMELLTQLRIPHSLNGIIAYFHKKLSEFDQYEMVGDIRALGMVGAMELVKDRTSKEKFSPDLRVAFRICQRAISLGLLIRPLGNVLYFMPPLTITEDQIDNMLFLLHKAIQEITNEL
jgi:adenosylmethionine-8-amino-7-oxononanoate aminotransferase